MEIQYKTKTVTIPEKIEDLSLNQYTKIVELVSELDMEDKVKSTLTLFSIVETVCGLKEEELDDFSLTDANDLMLKVAEKLKEYKLK
jgi:hypothetical protein